MLTTRGFTLMELILTTSLAAIMTLVLIPSSDNVGAVQVDGLAQRLRSDLHYAQQMATTTGTAHGFRAVSDTSYEIFVGAPGTPAIDPYKRTDFVINIADFFGAVQFTAWGDQPTVTFDTIGTPTIVGGPDIVVTDGAGTTKAIVITPNTGVAVIQ